MGVDFGYQKEMEDLIDKLDLNDKILLLKKPSREDVISAYHHVNFLYFLLDGNYHLLHQLKVLHVENQQSVANYMKFHMLLKIM